MSHYQPQPYQLPQPPMPTAPPKSPGVAAILSLIIPGLGHMYSGNPLAAAFWFGAAFVSALLIIVIVGMFMLPVVWIAAPVHAYMSTASFNARHNVIR